MSTNKNKIENGSNGKNEKNSNNISIRLNNEDHGRFKTLPYLYKIKYILLLQSHEADQAMYHVQAQIKKQKELLNQIKKEEE